MRILTICDFWHAMSELYGTRWTSTHNKQPSEMAEKIWKEALAGLNQFQLSSALRKLTHQPEGWPPTAPEFRALALSESAEQAPPAIDVAWLQLSQFLAQSTATRKIEKLHPAVRYAYRSLDSWSLQRSDGDVQMRLFKSAYNGVLQQLKTGFELPPEPKSLRLEHEPPAPKCTAEQAEASRVRIFALLENERRAG